MTLRMRRCRLKRRFEVWAQDLLASLFKRTGGYRLGTLMFRLLGRRPLFSSSAYAQARKLNIASAVHAIPGWLNVDVRQLPGVAVIADARHLPFRDSSFDIVRASHILEHLPSWDAAPTVIEWSRVLAASGSLLISVPDFDWIVLRYRRDSSALNFVTKDHDRSVMLSLYGEAFYEPKDWYHHWAIYNFESLTALLRHAANFTRFRIFNAWEEQPATLGHYDASMEPLSLNVAAQRELQQELRA